ncbi:PAQR family membrane homeostasis protein TrhA [Treponema brennaborense]|uniref:PAQR family membrane homeostasis protein TrhA n=1 Tax=Treponema brennaborense TaxID=81028 RepID=UPI00068D482B|nr:hemolysin III family protein [Treponema brennaborense]
MRAERKAAEAAIPKRYSIGEEIFNSVTHGIGAGLAAAAIVLLIVRAVVYAPDDGKGFYITSFAVFGASLFVLYLMSTLYHALTPYGAKKVFAIFDHSSIYLLIAGTYTPFCLTVLRGTMGWVLFAVIWGLAVAGMTFYAIFGSRMRLLSAVTYVLMGWLVVVAFKPMSETLPWLSLVLLITGGVAYTVGCIFYALKKIKWMHSVWHLFVIAGSAFHFFSVYYSIPV